MNSRCPKKCHMQFHHWLMSTNLKFNQMQLWSILCQSQSIWGLRQQNQMQGWVKIWNPQTDWSSWLLKDLEQFYWQGEAKSMRSFDSIATFSRRRVKCRRNKRETVCYHCMLFNFFLLKMATSTWGRDCSTHLWTVVQCLGMDLLSRSQEPL